MYAYCVTKNKKSQQKVWGDLIFFNIFKSKFVQREKNVEIASLINGMNFLFISFCLSNVPFEVLQFVSATRETVGRRGVFEWLGHPSSWKPGTYLYLLVHCNFGGEGYRGHSTVAVSKQDFKARNLKNFFLLLYIISAATDDISI